MSARKRPPRAGRFAMAAKAALVVAVLVAVFVAANLAVA